MEMLPCLTLLTGHEAHAYTKDKFGHLTGNPLALDHPSNHHPKSENATGIPAGKRPRLSPRCLEHILYFFNQWVIKN